MDKLTALTLALFTICTLPTLLINGLLGMIFGIEEPWQWCGGFNMWCTLHLGTNLIAWILIAYN